VSVPYKKQNNWRVRHFVTPNLSASMLDPKKIEIRFREVRTLTQSPPNERPQM